MSSDNPYGPGGLSHRCQAGDLTRARVHSPRRTDIRSSPERRILTSLLLVTLSSLRADTPSSQ